MDRKKFLLTSALTAVGISTFGSVVNTSNGDFGGDCETTSDILGPFYRPNAPIRSNLITKNLKGTRVNLKGQIFRSDCQTPIENAQVEIWHCDTEGNYDNESREFKHRARLLTNEKGEYSFETIIPGKFRDNNTREIFKWQVIQTISYSLQSN